jgi:AraC-like DNA-binding protein
MPLRATAFDATDWHSHNAGQFIFVERGVSHMHTAHGAFTIPERCIGWVPAGVSHKSRSSGGSGWVMMPPAALRGLPNCVCVLRSSALLSSTLQRLTRLMPDQRRLARLLWKVVAAEVDERAAAAERQADRLDIPMPHAPRLLEAVHGVLERPTCAANLDRVAARAGMSRRSFARHFRSQTGLPYSRWKRAVIAQHAMELVAAGHKVSAVAHDVGYESVSAFIAMIRRQYGQPPRQFSLSRLN